jgi:hypothetical protein
MAVPQPGRAELVSETESERERVSDQLRPYVDRGEAEAIDRIADRLERSVPAPPPGFRAELRSRLATEPRRHATWRPRRLRLLAAVYACSGLALLAIGALGVGGAGPFAT